MFVVGRVGRETHRSKSYQLGDCWNSQMSRSRTVWELGDGDAQESSFHSQLFQPEK